MKLTKTNLITYLVYPLALALFTFNVPAQTGYAIQVASPPSLSEAQAIVGDLKVKGVDAYIIKTVVRRRGTRFRVRIGRFATQAEAKQAGELSLNRGFIGEFIVTKYDPPAIDQLAANDEKSKPVTSQPTPEPAPVNDQIAAKGEKSRPLTSQPTTEPAPVNDQIAAKGEKSRPLTSQPTPEPAPAKAEKPPAAVNADKKPINDLADAAPEPPARETVTESAGGNVPPAEAMVDLAFNNRDWRIARRGGGQDKDLKAVFFFDSITGWAAGDDGATFRTTDGGRSWKPLVSGSPATIDFIYFSDWSNGWMLGEPDQNKESGRLLFTTNNGGRSWRHKPLPKIISLHFIDKLNGWAVGKDATVLKTTNGGDEWSAIPGFEQVTGISVEASTGNLGFRDVYFLNNENGWIIGNFYGRESSSIGVMFVTSDGGKSWKQMPLNIADSSGRLIPGELRSVRFSDVNRGSVTGELYDGDARFFFALHTRNGGQTWEQHRTPSRAAHSTRFINLSNGWSSAVAPRDSSAETIIYDTTFMRTDSGGKTWQDDFVARGGRIHDLFFLSPTKGWAVGDHGMILSYEGNRIIR
jgi:photosystem II stability/assembly factor-like uncharacterized protein